MFRKGKAGWLALNIVESVLLIAAGVLCLVFCNNKDFQNACILAVGIIVVLDALLRLVLDVVSVVSSGDATLIKTSYGQAITGSLELATGAILIMVGANKTDAGIIFEYLGWFIGILMIVLGIILCVYAGVYIAKKAGPGGKNLGLLLAGLLLIAAGILTIVFLTKQSTILTIFFVVFGLCLLLAGGLMAYLTFAYVNELKKQKKAAEAASKPEGEKEEAIEVEASEVISETPEDEGDNKPTEGQNEEKDA